MPKAHFTQRPREYDNDILKLWNQGLAIKEIEEYLGITSQIIRSRLLLIHKIPYEEVKNRSVPIIEKECEECHTYFKIKPHGGAFKAKFCSDACRNTHATKARSVKKTPEEKAIAKQKAAAYLRIEQSNAASEHFAWMERDKIRKQIRREGW